MQMQGEEVFLNLQSIRSPEVKESLQTPGTPISHPPQSPSMNLFPDTDWINFISREDLIDFNKKPNSSSTFMELGMEELTNELTSGSVQERQEYEQMCVAPSMVFFPAAPIKVEPTEPLTPKRGRKPKVAATTSALIPSTSTSAQATVARLTNEDVKPDLIGGKVVAANSRKRQSTSTDATIGGKRIKKYQVENSDDPSVKNALAARLNREKKKHEAETMKNELDKQRREIESLRLQLENERHEKEQLRVERDAERERNLSTNGLRGVAMSIKDFLATTLPALQANYGEFSLDYSEMFEAPLVPGNSSSVPQVGGVGVGDPTMVPENPSEFFTAHVNMPQRKIVLEYNPRTPHSVLCSESEFCGNVSPAA